MRPPTTPCTRAVDLHYNLRLFGECDGSYVFDAGSGPRPYAAPPMIDVPYWAYEEKELTRIATVGMSDVPLVSGTRIELHMAIARRLEDGPRLELAAFLANLASFPYAYATSLGRGDFLPEIGEVPLFPGMVGIFIDELGADPADEALTTAEGERVELHLAVPVLPAEIDALRAEGPEALRARWRAAGVDRFDPDRGGGRSDRLA